MIFYLSIISFFVLLIMGTVHYRNHVIPRLPAFVQSRLPPLPFSRGGGGGGGSYIRIPTSFAAQAAHGLSSSAFDLEQNIRGEDGRAGLDEVGAREVMEIMRAENVTFDEARLRRHNRLLARNGVDSTGMPLDAKAVTRL